MGNFASRVHSKEDGKVYNILPLGDMPTVVFGRVIKPNSVPGMQYYFRDGKVKWKDNTEESGYRCWGRTQDESHIFEGGCIFTIPENFDFSKMGEDDYMLQHTRHMRHANLNTTSPNYIIRDGHIICVKKINDIRNRSYTNEETGKKYKRLVIECKRFIIRFIRSCGILKGEYSEYTEDIKNNGLGGTRFRNKQITVDGNFYELDSNVREMGKNLPNNFTIIPVGRDRRFKSIYQYKVRRVQKPDYKQGGAKEFRLGI